MKEGKKPECPEKTLTVNHAVWLEVLLASAMGQHKAKSESITPRN